MENIWREIISALIMGLLLPGAIFGIADTGPAETVRETEPVLAEVSEAESIWLPVMTDENRIQILELEEYVLGVVLAEMPASFDGEALKAQAVVARTYALRRLEQGDRHQNVAICTDSACCQAYITQAAYLQERGSQADIDRVIYSVEATRGQVLYYEGELAEATYFSCSGGRTEDAVAVWGTEIPYLQAVDSPGEERSELYQNTVTFTAKEFATALGRELTGSPAAWLGQKTDTQGGGVASMVIGGISYTGVELRRLLGLNSTAFTMEAEQDIIRIHTRGRGHRVGMSQYGAEAMAVAGHTWQEILEHYYPGTRIDKLGAIG